MSEPSDDTSAVLEKARGHENKYEWTEAAKYYEQTLPLKSQDKSFISNVLGRIGFCYACASRQAENAEDFLKLCHSAAKAYKAAAEALECKDTNENQGEREQRKATAKFIESWLATTSAQRKEMLDECLDLGRTGLEKHRRSGDEADYAKMCNDLLPWLLERLYVASDWRELKTTSQEAVSRSRDAINASSNLDDKEESLRAFSGASLLYWYAANFGEQDERGRNELAQRSLSYSEEALELSKQVNSPLLTATANWAAAISTLVFTEKTEDALEYAEKMLEQAKLLRDNCLKGIAGYVLAFVIDWMNVREEEPDKKKEGYRKIIEISEQATRCLQPASQDYFIAEICSICAESYSSIGSDVELSLEIRKSMLGKAVETGRLGLKHAERSGSPDALGSTLHALSKALQFYSNLQFDGDEKKKLLEEGLTCRKQALMLVNNVYLSNDWLVGVNENYVGLIKWDIAKAETDIGRKKDQLGSAAADLEQSLSHCKRWISSRPVPMNIAMVAKYEDSYGIILNELFGLTGDNKFLQKAIEVHEDAAKQFEKIDLPSRAAESFWKMAMCQDCLGKNMEAAENFRNAFTEYMKAAKKIPHFTNFCHEYGAYMNAWSEIEGAKFAHDHENYGEAAEHYEKVATILNPSSLWRDLTSNFSAWSLLEKAEEYSRAEDCAKSLVTFKESADLFREAKEAFDRRINRIGNPDEKEKTTELSKASLFRKEYCIARADVEQAKIADRNGDHAESALKYESAANAFETMLEKVKDKEIEQIACMCRAWQKKEMGDSRISPELYCEASELFLKAKEHSTKDKTALLASGNSAFCKALEHGIRFEATREKDDFLKTKQHLENAANYYLKAGFDSASTWTIATEMFFDASIYSTAAETDTDPNKKLKAFSLVEKCLERSASLFEKAGYTSRKNEVLRTLAKVREKHEFALSLDQLLTVPTDASSTSMVTPPRMTVEEPLGLSKFEQAFVQANLGVEPKDLIAGGEFALEIRLVNLGKKSAFLTDIEQLIPEEFDLAATPEKGVVTNSGLNLRGKKLEPLETAEMKLTLKPKKKGSYIFTPRVKYMDETGECKSFEPEIVTVTVKELGIRGWLRGQT